MSEQDQETTESADKTMLEGMREGHEQTEAEQAENEEIRTGYEQDDLDREDPDDDGERAQVLRTVSKREIYDALQRYKRRDQRRLDQRIDLTWDRLQHQNEELHGSLVSVLRTSEETTKQLTDATGSMLRRGHAREVELSFAFPGDDAGEFRFTCTLEALKDDDVRDALAKGRGLLAGILQQQEGRLDSLKSLLSIMEGAGPKAMEQLLKFAEKGRGD